MPFARSFPPRSTPGIIAAKYGIIHVRVTCSAPIGYTAVHAMRHSLVRFAEPSTENPAGKYTVAFSFAAPTLNETAAPETLRMSCTVPLLGLSKTSSTSDANDASCSTNGSAPGLRVEPAGRTENGWILRRGGGSVAVFV